ncbi:MAG: 3-deoxy-D-manno-octulosonic acid transferase [Bacteroidetes bacterium]|nr:3-deoxy-D-manno-octulosonic acid transferase [Bacteroidota bacterium]
MLYLLGIRIFQILVLLASPFNSKAKLWLKGRKTIFKSLKQNVDSNEKIYWIHCASLGEFEQGRPLIEALKNAYPQYKILLTFYSPSGYEIRKNYEHADYVYYLPLDTPLNAKHFVEMVKPQAVFFVKYEFWYFFLREINKRNIPLYLVSGIFRKNQRFFKPNGIKSRKMLKWFTHFFVQNEESKELLQSINITNVSVAGDTRFDRVYDITQKAKSLPLIESFTKDEIVLIAGSSWKADEELLLKYFNESTHQFKLIIAPHEIHKENITRIEKTISDSKKILKFSEANKTNIHKADVLIIDSIGILSSVYKYGNIAYIGGGFGKGIHNILEAATFGLPILFGPNYLKFKEAIELIKLKGAFTIKNYDELKSKLDSFLSNQERIKESGKISSKYVEQNRGATAHILNAIKMD